MRWLRIRLSILASSVFLLAASLPGSATAQSAVPSPAVPAELAGLLNASQPEAGLAASGQPTAEQLASLARAGFKTLIDLRPVAEPRGFDEPAAAAAAGLRYLNVPVTLASLDPPTLDRFFAALRGAERPLLVHCATGNRVGALYYAWLVLERGVEPSVALDRARAAGLKQAELTDAITALVAERQRPKAN